MGRYANYGFEILYDEFGRIKGINFGYGDVYEHSNGYCGDELESSGLSTLLYKLSFGPFVCRVFHYDMIKDTSNIRLLEGSDGRVLLTNQLMAIELAQLFEAKVIKNYYDFSSEEIDALINDISNHPDKINDNLFDASWNKYSFNIVSTNEESKNILLDLYENIKNGDIAVSDSFPTLYGDRGLSFVYLDRLNECDVKKKYYSDLKKVVRSRKRK